MTLTIRRLTATAALVAVAALGVLASCDPGDDGHGPWRKLSHSTLR